MSTSDIDEWQSVTPRLRFPEFREAWTHTQIGPYLVDCTSRVAAPSSLQVYTSSRTGLKPQDEYYGGRTILNDGEYGVVPPECFVFRHMSDDGQFVFHTNETGYDIAVSKEYPVFRAVNLDRHFLLAKLNHSPEFKAFALSQKAGGTRTRLYFSRLRAWETLLPSLAEQEKIADCLTSLDKVIATQGRKVEALNAHKRGLMQQLFPLEGETVPRLRFPEFRDNDDEPEEVSLGEIVEVASGQVDPTQSPYCDLPHVGGENIESHTGKLRDVSTARELGLISGKYAFDEADVLYSKIRPALNKVAVPGFKGICSADIYPLRPSNGRLSPEYLANLLQTEAFIEYATKCSSRSKIPKVNRDELLAYEVPIPSRHEQQRIAACLSAVCSRITAEVEKLNVLKTHKTGLMQQLFPSPEADKLDDRTNA